MALFAHPAREAEHGPALLNQGLLPADAECVARPLFPGPGLVRRTGFRRHEGNQPDELFAAWLLVPDSKRNEMDTEFRVIFELSCEKGFAAIRDEARWHFIDQQKDSAAYTAFVEKLAALSNHFERAMLTFLDHNTFWKGASLFYHADTLPYWRKRKNLLHVAAAVDHASLRQLEGLTLAEARKALGRLKLERERGFDPQLEKKQARAEARRQREAEKLARYTVEKMVEHYIAERLSKQKRGDEGARLLRRELLPGLGDRPAPAVPAVDLRSDAARPIVSEAATARQRVPDRLAAR